MTPRPVSLLVDLREGSERVEQAARAADHSASDLKRARRASVRRARRALTEPATLAVLFAAGFALGARRHEPRSQDEEPQGQGRTRTGSLLTLGLAFERWLGLFKTPAESGDATQSSAEPTVVETVSRSQGDPS